VEIVGTFTLGTDFANDGTLIMTPQNFARYFAYRGRGRDPLSQVDIGLVHLTRGADARKVRDELIALLPRDVIVETKLDYLQREMEYWRDSTPVGFIFLLGVVLGFVVGIVICYQIIFANIADHQAEFATLKAMGYATPFFIRIVLGKSFYLSILGFIPGLLISAGIFEVLSHSTGLLMELTILRALSIYVLTLLMCITSGCLAIRKVLELEPADLF
jgi:putative ABC transport system permease protein